MIHPCSLIYSLMTNCIQSAGVGAEQPEVMGTHGSYPVREGLTMALCTCWQLNSQGGTYFLI